VSDTRPTVRRPTTSNATAANGSPRFDTVIRGGHLVGPGIDGTFDLGITDGRIAQISEPTANTDYAMSGENEIDATGRYVLPGGIDAHVHLTPPGTEPGSWRWVDDFEVGTRAAAAGGVTCVGNMSFPRKGEQMADGLARDVADADAHAIVDHFQHPVLLDPDAEGIAQIVVHLSSKAALDACRTGRARDLPLYVETRPIYLHLNEDRFADPDGAKYAGAPPLRTDDDRDALWAGINDGSVATVCTDHAPWTLEQKLDPELTASTLRHGMAELETMLPVLWSEGVHTGRISIARFVEVTSTQAAKLFGLYPRKGTIAPGSDADLIIWNPDEVRTVDGATMHSNAGYSPYDGWQVTGWPELTISRGEIVARGSDVSGEPGRGRQATRSRFVRP